MERRITPDIMKDSFNREITYLRLSITESCNLRCRYCMPEEGACDRGDELLTEDEMISAVRAAASLGVRKLRITGGEPLVKKNLLSICERSAAVEGIKELSITTNGLLLPKLAKSLLDAGVSRLNISLDTLSPEKFTHITRVGRLEDAMKGIESALSAGFKKIKINSVLVGGFNDDEIPALAALTEKYPIDVRFIELMPINNSREFGPDAFVPYTKVLEALPELTAVTDSDSGVAKLYRLPDALGNIGLISPINDCFCSSCNRLRITADGHIKPCLHAPAEYSIKGLSEEAMVQQLRLAITNKPEWHGELSALSVSKSGRSMNRIGG